MIVSPAASLAWVLVVLTVVGLAGVVLILVGWRGAWVGTHRHCRRCRFNLSGSAPDAAACPECGGDLAKPGAVRLGDFRRRRKTLIVGVVVVAASLPLIAIETLRRVDYPTLLAHLPAAALLWLYETDDVARDELLRRLNAGTLSQAQVDEATSHALRLQGDPAVPWDAAWGELIERAWVRGRLAPADASRYLEQAVTMRIKARPKVRRGYAPDAYGDPVVARVADTPVHGDYRWTSLRIDGVAVEASPSRLRGGDFDRDAGGGSASAYHLPLEPMREAEAGRVVIEAEAELDLSMTPMGASSPMLARGVKRVPPPAGVEIVEAFTGDYATGEDTTRAVRDGAKVAVVDDASRGGRFLMIALDELPADVDAYGFGYFVRAGGPWRELNAWRRSSGSARDRAYVRAWIKPSEIVEALGHEPDAVDVMLRTDIDSAETDAGPKRHWLGEVVFESVPMSTGRTEVADIDTVRPGELDSIVRPTARILTPLEAEAGP